MARRNAKRRRRNRTRESSHERVCRSNPAPWTSPAIPVLGALESLDRCVLLYLFVADRPCVLVAVAFLDRGNNGWRADFANSASVGRFDFLLRGSAHVRLLV